MESRVSLLFGINMICIFLDIRVIIMNIMGKNFCFYGVCVLVGNVDKWNE